MISHTEKDTTRRDTRDWNKSKIYNIELFN